MPGDGGYVPLGVTFLQHGFYGQTTDLHALTVSLLGSSANQN